MAIIPRNIDDERELAIRAKTSMAAFGELYDRYLDSIYNFVLRRVGNEKDAEDLTALTFEKALLNMERYEWQGISFSAWLYRIAANNVADFFRRSRKYRLVNLEESELILGHYDMEKEHIENHHEREMILRCMTRLPVQYQLVLSLKFFEDLSNEEMAEILGCSKSNLAVKVYRSLKALRKVVDSDNGSKTESIRGKYSENYAEREVF